MLDGGGVARHRMAGLGLVSSALLSGEGHAMLAAAARWCLGDGASAAGAAGAGMLAVLARQSRWQAATLMSLEQVLAVAGAELSTEYTLALSTLAATPPPPPPPPLPTPATSLPERCACPLCGMSAAGPGHAAASRACNPTGFGSHLDEAAEPSDAQLAEARREYIARALGPWREKGVAAAEVGGAIPAGSPPTRRLHPDSPKPCHPTDPSLQLTRWSGPAGCNLPSGACGTSWSAASCSPSAVSQRRATTPLFPRVTHRLTRSQTLSLSHTPSHTLTHPRTHPLSPFFAGEPAPINHHHRKRMRGVRQVLRVGHAQARAPAPRTRPCDPRYS